MPTYSIQFSDDKNASAVLMPGSTLIIGRYTVGCENVPNRVNLVSKIVSRNHAILFNKDSKLYIQDTKSSGGTFVNGYRLSESGEESGLEQLHLGDIIFLGENSDEDDDDIFTAVSMKIGIHSEPLLNFYKRDKSSTLRESSNLNELENKVDIQKLDKVNSVTEISSDIVNDTKKVSLTELKQKSKSDMAEMPQKTEGDEKLTIEQLNDSKIEFDGIWQNIQKGLDQNVNSYLELAKPFAETLKSKGVFGDIVENHHIDELLGQTKTKSLTNYEEAGIKHSNSASNSEKNTSLNGEEFERILQSIRSLAQ